MATKRKPNNKCKLFPVVRRNIISIQDAQQHAGWQITAFNLPLLWRYTQGEGVRVAFLDTGCELDHPDLKDNLLPGMNLINPNLPPADDNQHGTHAIGILCAANNDIGMVGVAPQAKAIPIKVLDADGNGDMEAVAEGIIWAVDNNADIISVSLGSPDPSQQLRKAVQYATKVGIPVFVAAGNSGCTQDVFYPAAYPETIAVGSIDENFNRSNFSCTGKNLDFMAPGHRILSTVPKHWYAVLSGTSMATPWAAGVAALVLSAVKQKLLNVELNTVEDYRNVLRSHTIDVTHIDLNNKGFYEGFGIIDSQKLFEQVKPQIKI
jgi:subtilisin